MVKKEQDPAYPLTPAANGDRSDTESALVASKQLRRKKCIKYLIYGLIFAVFQTGIILLFSFTLLKFRTPKFRLQSATFETFDSSTGNGSFNLKMNAEFGVKNTNFGPFKYQNSSVGFFYRDILVGEAFVHKARAKLRSTRKFNVWVNLNSSEVERNLELESDLNSGVLSLTSQSKLRGKIRLMFVFSKKKSTDMSCIMELVMTRKVVQNVVCK